ncbi:hypothetical protein [Paenibacillus sedimenti]|uniref:Endolytic transglycosylase MltG n=1 Tax=Paenibacillus sedimenti TaxID=2770274 RepID=A0A926KNF0_9BACL|nr:hypothetical protein [Paenibacillus sedimenti]MBD0380328.1 hypothetical protein [Paenibacillus sedimenti]
MLKNRSYVSGIGTGIIIGAFLLQIMAVRPSAPGSNGAALDALDPQKLKEQASKYFQVFDKETKVYTQADFDAGVQKKVKEETDKLSASKPKEQPQPGSPAIAQRTVIYVQPNQGATTVSELLLNVGIIADRKAFTAELDKQGGSNKIQVGAHVFESGMDMQQVVKILITVK